MIKIVFSNKALEISGHSGYSSFGKDIVCAGVSAIFFGAINWFKKNDVIIKQNKKKNSCLLCLKKCSKNNQEKLKLLIKQFYPLQKKYSKYIKIKKSSNYEES